jgi:hypothetical protein
MWRRILAYILFALGFLTIGFFRTYHGTLFSHPFLYWLLGFSMFVGGLLFLRYTPTTNQLKNRKKIEEQIAFLKQVGTAIDVDLTRCEIKEHTYTEEQNRYSRDNELLTLGVEREIEGLNAIGGGSWRNVKQVEVKQSVIIFLYEDPSAGTKEKFISRVIPKDKVTLGFYLERKEHTTLYVDKTDRKNYYFDLDFLS